MRDDSDSGNTQASQQELKVAVVAFHESGRAPFVGACYHCQAAGHRAAECPRIRCYRCGKYGHISRRCSLPAPTKSRQPVTRSVNAPAGGLAKMSSPSSAQNINPAGIGRNSRGRGRCPPERKDEFGELRRRRNLLVPPIAEQPKVDQLLEGRGEVKALAAANPLGEASRELRRS